MTVALRTLGWTALAVVAFIWFTTPAWAGDGGSAVRTWRVGLVQFDAVPEQPERNLREMERLARQAVNQGARLVMFNEGTLTDYTPRLNELAERVPDGPRQVIPFGCKAGSSHASSTSLSPIKCAKWRRSCV